MASALRDRIRMVFFDIDDTIYSKHTDSLSASVEKMFTRLREHGVEPAIATGRARYIFPKKLEEVIRRTGVEYFVTINGQLNLRGETLISDYPFDQADVDRLVAHFRGQGMPLAFAGQKRMTVAQDDPVMNAALDPITREHPLDPHFAQGNAIYQMIVGYDESRQARVDASGVLENGRFKTVRWHPDAVDLLYTEGSKVRGIADVIRTRGLTLDNVMVFGDSLNDLEMLSEAGFGVAMGNGHPEAKKVADFIAGNQDEDGAYRALIELGILDAG
ncbi:MAG: Cof-type HAD-IIB family hydrolase [Lautropia sp.]|nr:Cof-type HAD-IIB family hydrolase [Lautropia sp.]